MISSLGNSISGLNAAEKRINVAANNIANQFSTARQENGKTVNEPYVPQQVQAVSEEAGGVTVKLVDKNPASIPIPGENGEVKQLPNVDTAEELVNIKIATYDAKANIAVIHTENKMQQSLLDIFV
jgi:flagellar basal body rod protein FlgC